MANEIVIKITREELHDCDVVLAKTILKILEEFDTLTEYSKYEDINGSLIKMKDAFRWLTEASTSMTTKDEIPEYVTNGLHLFASRFHKLWV